MIKNANNGIILKIKIIPNSPKNAIIIEDSFIKVKITAQPIENKANKALIEFLSEYFKIPKTYIEIVKGNTSKEKSILLKINADKAEEIKEKLAINKKEEGIL